jgi:flagellar biosynthesis protein FlhG
MENFNAQTYSLKQLAARKKDRPHTLARAISITSGKGGVGKSNIAINLGLALQELKKNVIILDADLGLANVDVLLGKKPLFNINHVIEGQKKVEDIIMEVENGLKIIPASSGIEKLASLDQDKMDQFIEGLKSVEHNVDFFIIDTAAGITQAVLHFLIASNEVFVVTTNEPTAITDAYAIIKAITHRKKEARVRVIVNMCRSYDEALSVFNKINAVSLRFLNKNLEFLGGILKDETVSLAVRQQSPFVLRYPKSEAAAGIFQIARKMLENRTPAESGNLQDFFTNIKGLMS